MVKTAVIGAGYLGSFHAEKYAKLKNSSLSVVVAIDQSRAASVAKKHKAEASTDYRCLPEKGVAAASIVSDTATHFEIAAWLLSNGVDVLVEKPITTTSDEAKELIRLAAIHNRILQVGHLERFNPAFQAMVPYLDRPRFFEVTRIAPFKARGHDVDVVLDLMIHDIDIISHIVGAPLAKVDAVGVPVLTQTADIANARLTFANGAIANVTASRAGLKSERMFRVFQPDRYISLDFGNKKLKVFSRKEGAGIFGIPNVAYVDEKIKDHDALEAEIAAFLTAVETRNQPIVTGEDGLRAMELATAIREAFAESFAEFERLCGEPLRSVSNA